MHLLSQEALELIPPSWVYSRGGAILYLSLGMQATGYGKDAETLLLNEYAALEKKTDSYAMRLLMVLGFLYIQAGLLEQARQVAAMMLQQPILNDLPIMKGWAHYFLGMVHYQWNDMAEAQQHFSELVAQRYSIHSVTARNGLSGLALIHQYRGNAIESSRTADLLSDFDLEQVGFIDDSYTILTRPA